MPNNQQLFLSHIDIVPSMEYGDACIDIMCSVCRMSWTKYTLDGDDMAEILEKHAHKS